MNEINRRRNISNEATIEVVDVGQPAVAVSALDERRIHFELSIPPEGRGVWLRLMSADDEPNEKKGIYIPAGDGWRMPSDNIFVGEISCIARRQACREGRRPTAGPRLQRAAW